MRQYFDFILQIRRQEIRELSQVSQLNGRDSFPWPLRTPCVFQEEGEKGSPPAGLLGRGGCGLSSSGHPWCHHFFSCPLLLPCPEASTFLKGALVSAHLLDALSWCQKLRTEGSTNGCSPGSGLDDTQKWHDSRLWFFLGLPLLTPNRALSTLEDSAPSLLKCCR